MKATGGTLFKRHISALEPPWRYIISPPFTSVPLVLIANTVGVANLLVRTLTKKGYIRATQVGWKRWVYVLTPAGIARKANLTFGYVERFVDHYRRVRVLLRDDLGALAMDPESPIAIYGTTDLAELIYLALRDMGLTRIDFYDHEGRESDFLGMKVRNLKTAGSCDG